MWLIDAQNAAQYLRDSGHLTADESVTVRELSGGVSNVVLLVAAPDGTPRFVLKQAREQLRVPEPWFCSVNRIWREIDVLDVCERVLAGSPAGRPERGDLLVTLPRVLFSDRENYLFAMTAAPPHEVWKQRLLAGQCEITLAAACGRLLGQLHAGTWEDEQVARRLGDQTFFESLRIDPYYRHVARHSLSLAGRLEELIASVTHTPRCLVHGDFSPKNILVSASSVMLVDCEVGHFGDPAFDLGFFLSHLMLKAFRARQRWWDYARLTFAFWGPYEQSVRPRVGDEEFGSLVGRGIRNFAGCCLARVDGKSKVDYLEHGSIRIVREAAAALLEHPPSSWSETVACLLPYFWDNGAQRGGDGRI